MQQQISQILTTAKAQGYNVEQVIPEDLQAQFQEMTELKAAREFIKDLESREQDLQIQNAKLSEALQSKQAEIDNQPAEFESLKTDLSQAHRNIEFYKNLAHNAERRALRYQRNFDSAVQVQIASDVAAAKIERLEAQIAYQQIIITRLQDENFQQAQLFDQLRDQDQQAMAENDQKAHAALQEASWVETESEQASEVYDDLIDTIESDHADTTALLNTRTALLHQQMSLYSGIASEVTPLQRFFTRAFEVLQIYQILFQTLSDPEASGIASLPPQLDTLLSSAAGDLEGYVVVHAALPGIAEERVRNQLHELSGSATEMLSSFRCIKRDVHTFLQRVKSDPIIRAALKAKKSVSGSAGTRRWSLR
jgi:chromosome segregation ATPase